MKETLEEAAENHMNKKLKETAERLFPKEKYPTEFEIFRKCFISNAKWVRDKINGGNNE
jgi:hypothetical protein